MIAALDVNYVQKDMGAAAAVVFKNILKMHGSYRIPKLLKQVDSLAKEHIKK